MQVAVASGALAMLGAEKGALEHQHAAVGEARLEREDPRAGVAGIRQPDLLVRLLDALPGLAPGGDRRPFLAGEIRAQAPPLAQQVVTETGNAMVDGERLDRQTLADRHPAAGLQADDLEAVFGALQARRRGEERLDLGDDLPRADDPCRPPRQAALRDDEGQTEGVVEMAVAEEQILGSLELGDSAADVERQARRMDAKPGGVAGPRLAVDRQLAEPQARAQRALR